MQQHHVSQEESAEATEVTYVSGEMRVTPQELAQAVMSLEARKEAASHAARDTVPIADVIEHLGLEVTPEELLAEVAAQRRRQMTPTQTAAETALTATKTHRALSAAIYAGGLLWLGATFLFITLYLNQSSQMARSRALAQQLAIRNSFTAPPPAANILSNPMGLQSLASIVEGQPSYARFSDVVGLANGTSSAKIMVAPTIGSLSPGMPQWEILKFRGHYFVRAWRFRPEAMKKYPAGTDEWVSAQVSDADTEYADQIPIERFKSIKEPPSIVNTDTQLNEQVYMPEIEGN